VKVTAPAISYTVYQSGASIPMGQGDTSPQYLDRGDMITNVPPPIFLE